MHSKKAAIVIVAVAMLVATYAQNADGTGDNLPIEVGKHPVDVAINDKTNMLYVANSDSSSISVINGSSNQVVDTIYVNITEEMRNEWEGEIGEILIDRIVGMEINPTTNVIYVAKAYYFTLLPTGDAARQMILAINGSTNEIINKVGISTDLRTVKMAADPNKNLLYVIFSSPFFCTSGLGECGMRFPERIYALNGSNNSWDIHSYIGYDNALDIEFNPETNLMYIVRLDEVSHTTLLAYDRPVTNFSEPLPVELFGTEGNITGMTFDSDTGRIYLIVNSSSSFVAAIEGDGKLIGTVDIPKPSDIALNSETDTVYVTHPNDNLVSIIDVSTLETIERIALSERPISVEVDSESNMIYIVNQASNSVTVIDGETNTVMPEFTSSVLIAIIALMVGLIIVLGRVTNLKFRNHL